MVEHAPPKRGRDHWKTGRSARECAAAWCEGQSGPRCPREISELLSSHPDTFGAIVVSATPEHKIAFDKFAGEPRNSDMVAVADHPTGRLAVSIEAKADETFGRLIRAVLQEAVDKIAADIRTNAVLRVQQLACSILPEPTRGTVALGDLRYQLLTGIAGAVAFAAEVGAKRAVFIVHEFNTDQTVESKLQANARDLNAFVCRLSDRRISLLSPGVLQGPFTLPGKRLFSDMPPLYIGKAVRELRSKTLT
jgi:hypothetical protein